MEVFYLKLIDWSNNFIFTVGGCIFITFRHQDSQFNITDSVFKLNNACYGGAAHMAHDSGSVFYSRNTFIENSTPNISFCAGGVFSVTGFQTTNVMSFGNYFFSNFAVRGTHLT